jgi:hypothetical protein
MNGMRFVVLLLALLALAGCGNEEGEQAARAAGFAEGQNLGYKEGYERGRAASRKETNEAGYKNGYEIGHDQGYAEGEREGKESGYKAGHDTGYAEGEREGKKIGYKEGFRVGETEGLDKYKPGTPSQLSGIGQEAYKWIVRFGALKLFFSLFFVSFLLIKKSLGYSHEFLGKILAGVFGSSVTVAVAAHFHVAQTAEDAVLKPAVHSTEYGLLMLFVTGIGMYGLLEILYRFTRSPHGALVEGWIIIILSSMMAMLSPIVWAVLNDIPDATPYFAANLFTGPFFATLYWLLHGLLNGRFAQGSPAIAPEPVMRAEPPYDPDRERRVNLLYEKTLQEKKYVEASKRALARVQQQKKPTA